jgi:hypothetical protein
MAQQSVPLMLSNGIADSTQLGCNFERLPPPWKTKSEKYHEKSWLVSSF